MIKVHNIHIGAKSDLYQLNDDWAFVHACKTSHKERLGYTKPPKNEGSYQNPIGLMNLKASLLASLLEQIFLIFRNLSCS